MFQVSLIASAIRTPLYQLFLDSLKGSKINIEVVFAGHVTPEIDLVVPENVTFRYITTGKIKPAQCYCIARRAAKGELICWVADDAEFMGGVIDKAYAFWKGLNDEKALLSIQTREHYAGPGNREADNFCNMTLHSFFGGKPETPLMAPLGMMSRAYLDRLGGIDRRYVAGQYENDIAMRVYADGGKVVPFGDRQSYVDINHIGKESIMLGRKATHEDFLNRSFGSGYANDRAVLEASWCMPGTQKVSKERIDAFVPFNHQDILTKSQGPCGAWQ
jgi:hypothetical protein